MLGQNSNRSNGCNEIITPSFWTFQIAREEVMANLAKMQAVGSSPTVVKPVPANLNLSVKETVFKSELNF